MRALLAERPTLQRLLRQRDAREPAAAFFLRRSADRPATMPARSLGAAGVLSAVGPRALGRDHTRRARTGRALHPRAAGRADACLGAAVPWRRGSPELRADRGARAGCASTAACCRQRRRRHESGCCGCRDFLDDAPRPNLTALHTAALADGTPPARTSRSSAYGASNPVVAATGEVVGLLEAD